MAWSAVLLIPFLIIHAPLSQGAYWSPKRVFGGAFGIEDALFCLSFGVLGWGFAALYNRHLPQLAPLNLRFGGRVLAVGLFGGAVFVILAALGLSFGVSAFVCQFAVAAVLVAFRPHRAALAAVTSIALTIYYIAGLGLMVMYFGEEYAMMWSRDGILGPLIFGIPVEEYLWTTSFGAAWVPTLLFAAEPIQNSISEKPA